MKKDEDGKDTDKVDSVIIELENVPYTEAGEDYIYVMLLDDNGEISTEPYIPTVVMDESEVDGKTIKTPTKKIQLKATDDLSADETKKFAGFTNKSIVLVDYYVERSSGVSEITITPDKFGGYYYLEASTLFRNTDGVDMPAEFVIPNCKIQSNFTFTMASSGDPSTFTFTIDAFPDYTRFDKTKKVLAAIQVITEAEGAIEITRDRTKSAGKADANGMIYIPAEG
jgi:hypothetical protein